MSPRLQANLLATWIAATAALAAAAAIKGALYLDGAEGDALHMIQAVALMAEGLAPHRDFMTPTGILAFWPIALGVERGLPIGASFHLAQAGVALAILPLLWWTAVSRLGFRLGLWFGVAVLILLMSPTDAGGGSLAVSEHHLRWAWAFAFVAVTVAVVGARHGRGRALDGVALGTCLSILFLLEAAFFAGLAPGVLLALALRRRFLSIAAALLAGAAVTLAVNAVFGAAILWDYLGDLLREGSAPVPPLRDSGTADILTAPPFAVGAILLAFAVRALRRVGAGTEAAALIALAPGFLWITHRSGGDPLWLLVLAVLLFGSRLRSPSMSGTGSGPMVAAVAFASVIVVAGPWIGFAAGQFRHLAADPSAHVQALPESPVAQDILLARTPAADPEAAVRQSHLIGLGAPPGALRDDDMFLGEPLPRCRSVGGAIGAQRRLADQIAARAAVENSRIFVADEYSALWLAGAGEPVEGVAIRNFGDPIGFEGADFLVVPLCPLRPDIRRELLRRIEAEFADRLQEEARGGSFILLRLNRRPG